MKESNLIAKELQKPYELKTKLHVHAVDARRRPAHVVQVEQRDVGAAAALAEPGG